MKSILIADDEEDILEILNLHLSNLDVKLYSAKNGKQALSLAIEHKPNLILLDIMMPEISGYEVCKAIRKEKFKIEPIIVFLTARSDENSEIKALELGADDYIQKPLKIKTLMARVSNYLKRFEFELSSKLIFDNLIINKENYEVIYNNISILMPRKEFDLLFLLASKPGKVYNRDEILNKVWGNEVYVGDRTIDVHVRKIREKINEDYIQTVKGVGYKFNWF